ncbi:DUF6090 family protein [Algoriphagus marinus]|uniref:DUF6090 family protein n=1 Tax=Algoriphagus marinus TaxID=1925762 RepID=UPI00094B84B7|nr:DUF6090 family protein [Algoriphagus marinus]
MISFFRKIRQKLLSQNRVTRYLVYALGEIALVMIGILLALQVNNWNEARKESREEERILINLNSEFKTNLDQLNTNLASTDTARAAAKRLLNLISKTITRSYSSQGIDSLVRKSITNPAWFPSSLSLADLINSGRITKLNNPNLRQLINQYNNQLDAIMNYEKLNANAYEYYIDYIKLNGNLRRIDHVLNKDLVGPSGFAKDNTALVTQLEFENALDDYFIFLGIRSELYQKAAEHIQKILDETQPKSL